jgi:oxygen-dependent protoporphyrinogen oxidase
MAKKDRWIVVGGGASGIAAAFYLQRHGIEVEIIEKNDMLGGRIGSLELGGRLVDFGGKNIGRKYTLFREFTAAMGDHPYEYFGVNSSQVRQGQIVTFDSTRRWRGMLDLVRGAAPGDLVRFAGLVARLKANEDNGYLTSGSCRRLGQRFDRRPVSAYFSDEFCRRILRPMSVRMNGAEPDEIYLGNLGSNVRMILDSYDQLKNGMRPVLDSFSRRHQVHLGTSAHSLLSSNGRLTGLRIQRPDGTLETLDCSGVILATPAPIATRLVQPVLPELAQTLDRVAYYPVALILAEYDRPIFTPQVRALVFDEHEPVSNAGAYGVHDLHVVRYTYSGRAARRFMANAGSMEELLSRGEEALNRHFPVAARERKGFVGRQFKFGLCAYTPFHGTFLQEVSRRQSRLKGLHITGDYIQGVSIEACFRAAKDCVRKALAVERVGC